MSFETVTLSADGTTVASASFDDGNGGGGTFTTGLPEGATVTLEAWNASVKADFDAIVAAGTAKAAADRVQVAALYAKMGLDPADIDFLFGTPAEEDGD